MKPTDALFQDMTDDELRSLPKGWIAVYLGRPTRKTIDGVKIAMRLRVAGLLLLALYLYGSSGIFGTPLVLIFALACYEFAYYNLRKEKAELDYHLAQAEYTAEVNALHAGGA